LRNRRRQLLATLETAGPGLHALLMRLTLREDVAEELMQELFIRLHRSDGFADAANPAGYAYRAAMRLAFDWHRTQKRMLVAVPIPDDAEAKEPSPLCTLLEREQLEQVLRAANELTELCRDAFVMRYIQQDSYEVIGERLDKTPHQVRGLCHRAVQGIRDVLSGETLFAREEVSHAED
jgi:RNA polymerase sigma-70 factor (ECF subfamily)